MSIELNDDDVRALFADYRGTQSPRVRAAGVAAARRRGLARRRRRYGFLATVAVVGLLAPAAAFALAAGGGAPIGGDRPGPQRTGGEIPAGGLARAQLMVSSVQMPVFEGDTTGSCPHGEVGFADDRLNLYTFPDTGEYLSYADVDRDGSFETVLQVRCLVKEKVVAEQVLVVARGEGASVRLKGRVVGTGGAISAIDRVDVGRDARTTGEQFDVISAIFVKVAGPRSCCGGFYTAVEHQWRVYVWEKQGFKQQAGSNSFGRRPPADLVVEAQELRFEAGVGSFVVTVTNAGNQAVDTIWLTLVARGLRTADPEWRMLAPGTDPTTVENRRPIVGLQPGDSRTVAVQMQLSNVASRSGSLSATVVGVLGEGEIYDEAADANPSDNEKIEVALRFD